MRRSAHCIFGTRADGVYNGKSLFFGDIEPFIAVFSGIQLLIAVPFENSVNILVRKAGSIIAHCGNGKQCFMGKPRRMYLFCNSCLDIFLIGVADFDIAIMVWNAGQHITVNRRAYGRT